VVVSGAARKRSGTWKPSDKVALMATVPTTADAAVVVAMDVVVADTAAVTAEAVEAGLSPSPPVCLPRVKWILDLSHVLSAMIAMSFDI
jgi:hypothetical protein